MLPLDHPDRIQITFDDHRLVANAGLLLPVTLAQHLGLRELVDSHVDLGAAPGRANTGDKIVTLVASALAGGDCIDVLRTGRTAGALGYVVCQGRRQFVDQRVQELGRLDKGVSATIAKSTRRHIAWLEKEIARLEKEYQAVLQDNATLADRAALYRTVPGIGPLTAATLVVHLPELGHWDSKALTSLGGLAPWSRDSGKKRGHRAIRGGRGLVRRALYMCAWAVIRHDSEMRRFYDRLRQRGKPENVAVVAVMRKILLQLNAVARRGTPWVPQDA